MTEDSTSPIKDAYKLFGLQEGDHLEAVRSAYAELARGKTDWDYIKELDRAYELITASFREADSTGNGLISSSPRPYSNDETRDIVSRFKELLMPDEKETNPLYFWGRTLFFAVLVLSSLKFVFAPISNENLGGSFMHLINLPFHEAGHLIFRPLGDFMSVLGGSFMQVLIPLICVMAFVKQKNPFAASFAFWWTGQSLVDLAPYIYDARAGQLMLLGGVTGQDAPDYHDWHNLLERLGLLQYDHGLAYTAKYVGVLFIILSLVWGLLVLIGQHRTTKSMTISNLH